MRANSSSREPEDAFVATVKARLQHEFFEPGQKDLRLLVMVDDSLPNPTVVAIGEGQGAVAEDRFVGVFSIDRATFDEALASGEDPIEAGEFVYLRCEHAAPLVDALTRVFKVRARKSRSNRRRA